MSETIKKCVYKFLEIIMKFVIFWTLVGHLLDILGGFVSMFWRFWENFLDILSDIGATIA